MTQQPPESAEPSNAAAKRPSEQPLPPQVADLFTADPLTLTEDDLTFLAQYYQARRLEFGVEERRPKTVRSSRGPKLDATASKARLNSLLGQLVGERKKAPSDTSLDEPSSETEGEE